MSFQKPEGANRRKKVFIGRQVRLILVIAALCGCTWLLAKPSQDPSSKPGKQPAAYSIHHFNNDALMLDALRGKTWMLRKVEDGTPTWLPIPRIDSEKEVAHLWRKSSDNAANSGKDRQSLPLETLLKERGYIGISLHRLKAGYLGIDLTIEGKKVFLAVDTAAPFTHLDVDRVKHLKLDWQPYEKREGIEKSLPTQASSCCEITKLEIGGCGLAHLVIGGHDLSDINKSLKLYLDPQLDGVLGSDVLTKLNAIIDYSTCKLYVRSTETRKR